jgi:hypothetical protein
MTLPGTMVKNKKPIVLALPAELAAVLKKQFRKVGEPIFDCTNFGAFQKLPTLVRQN